MNGFVACHVDLKIFSQARMVWFTLVSSFASGVLLLFLLVTGVFFIIYLRAGDCFHQLVDRFFHVFPQVVDTTEESPAQLGFQLLYLFVHVAS